MGTYVQPGSGTGWNYHCVLEPHDYVVVLVLVVGGVGRSEPMHRRALRET